MKKCEDSKVKYQLLVKSAIKVVARSLGIIWQQFKKSKHETFCNRCSEYLGLKFMQTPIAEFHTVIKDTELIHTPFSKDIDLQLTRQFNRIKEDSDRLHQIESEVYQFVLKCNGPIGMDIDNQVVYILRLIWGDSEIEYFYDDNKKNGQMFSYIVTLFLSSIAFFAKISNEFPLSNEVEIPKENLTGWLSAPAVAMGIDGLRYAFSTDTPDIFL